MRIVQRGFVFVAVNQRAEPDESLSERRKVMLVAVEPAAPQQVVVVDAVVDADGVLIDVRRHYLRREEIGRAARTVIGQGNQLVLDGKRCRRKLAGRDRIVRERQTGWRIDHRLPSEIAGTL